MSRTFIYARVSTSEQHADNQIHEIEAAGFSVNERRIVTESISGSVAASERPQFSRLIDRLEGWQTNVKNSRKTLPTY